MKRYIGICKKSPQGNSNYGTVWEQGEDGLYRSAEDAYVNRKRPLELSVQDVFHDLSNGYLAELTPETVDKLQGELGRNPTTIELADYMSGRLILRKVNEGLNVTTAAPREIGKGAFIFPSEEYFFPPEGHQEKWG